MKKTGVFATEEEVERLKEMIRVPYIIAGGREPASPQETCHKLALEHGLPEIQGFYGMILETREFVTCD